MDKKELSFILQQGEGLRIEFKEKFDKSLAKEIIAFANSEGGKIFLGVNDKGKVCGINISNKLKSQIQDLARNCDPEIKINIEKHENVLIINVEEGKDKPYKCSSGFYLRQGANSQKLSRNEILKLVTGLGKVKFDEQINKSFEFPKDFDKGKFLGFLKRSNISKATPLKEILINLSLVVDDKGFRLNNAGILLFAKEPERFFRQNFISCVLYKGNERVNIIDRKDFKKDLLTNYIDGINFLKQHLRVEYVIKDAGPREEILELPEKALREVLINAIIHRDYFEERFGIFVEIFDDRLEITNFGKLLFDKSKLGKISFPRNPILFDMFHRVGLIEKVGSGINRIKDLIKKRGLRIKFEVDDFFKVVFYRDLIRESLVKKVGEGLVERLVERLVESQKEIIRLISKDSYISKQELSKKIGISTTAIDKNISKLKQKGLLKRVGPAKGGYWKITK